MFNNALLNNSVNPFGQIWEAGACLGIAFSHSAGKAQEAGVSIIPVWGSYCYNERLLY